MSRSHLFLLGLFGLLASANATLYALNDTSSDHIFHLVTVDPATGNRMVVSKTGAAPSRSSLGPFPISCMFVFLLNHFLIQDRLVFL